MPQLQHRPTGQRLVWLRTPRRSFGRSSRTEVDDEQTVPWLQKSNHVITSGPATEKERGVLQRRTGTTYVHLNRQSITVKAVFDSDARRPGMAW